MNRMSILATLSVCASANAQDGALELFKGRIAMCHSVAWLAYNHPTHPDKSHRVQDLLGKTELMLEWYEVDPEARRGVLAAMLIQQTKSTTWSPVIPREAVYDWCDDRLSQ